MMNQITQVLEDEIKLNKKEVRLTDISASPGLRWLLVSGLEAGYH